VYYNYYKCQTSGHNNISAIKAHNQLSEVWKYMSLSSHIISEIKDTTDQVFEQKLKDTNKILNDYLKQLQEAEQKLKSVEEKWILNQLSFESYQRWYTDLTNQRMSLNAQIEKLSQDQSQVWTILQAQLIKLEDLNYIYERATTVQKQQFVRLVFDSRLYYKDATYRTPYIMPILSYNTLILKEKQLLVLDEKRGFSKENPLRWSSIDPNRTPLDFLSFISKIQVA
jgi:site-specific DNA recombinase